MGSLQAPKRVHTLLRPKPGSVHTVLDVLALLLSGSWLFGWIALATFQLIKPGPNAYPCAGPGVVDFGCTGGTEMVMSVIVGVIFALSLLSIFCVALVHVINRVKGKFRD